MVRRNAEVKRKVKAFKKHISKKYEIKRMILFGSYARGTERKHSDVDLMVVSPKFRGSKIKAAASLYEEWHLHYNMGLPVDFLCYSPDEFEKLSNRISIVSQAIKEEIEI